MGFSLDRELRFPQQDKKRKEKTLFHSEKRDASERVPGRKAAAAAALQSCPTLCDPIDSSPPGSPRPWDSPGKNTGVGCHFLLQSMKVKSESEVAQSHPTLSDPKDCSPAGSSIHGIFQVRVLQWGRYYCLLWAGRLGISKWRQWAAIITSFLSMSGGNRLKLSDFFPFSFLRIKMNKNGKENGEQA